MIRDAERSHNKDRSQSGQSEKKGAGDSPPDEHRKTPQRESSGWQDAAGLKSLVLTAIVALIFGAGGAWAYAEFLGPSESDQQESQAQNSGGSQTKGKSGSGQAQSGERRSSGSQKPGGGKSSGNQDKSDGAQGQSGESASQIPGFTSADDAETLKKQLKRLSSRLDSVNKRIDEITQPKNQTPPVLHTLQIQVADLSKTVDEVAKLPSQVRRLEHRLSSLVEKFKTLREDAAADDSLALPGELETRRARRSRRSDGSTGPGGAQAEMPSEENEDDADDDDATLELGIDLFEAGRYAQAREVFRRLQRQRPNDARIWYFSALSNGLITHDWGGETERLFEQAAQRERAGTPSKAKIDAALTGLMPGEAERHLQESRPVHEEQTPSENPAGSDKPDRSNDRLSNQSLEVP